MHVGWLSGRVECLSVPIGWCRVSISAFVSCRVSVVALGSRRVYVSAFWGV